MKKFLLALLIISVAMSASVFAEEEIWWGSNYMPGNLILEADLAVEQAGESIAALVYPEVEYILHKPYFSGISPLDIGAAVRARIGLAVNPDAADNLLAVGVGAFGTLHFGLKGLEFLVPEIIDNTEVFVELGLGINILKHRDADFPVVFASKSGVAYHLNKVIAVKAGYTNWGRDGGAFLGAHLKFGPGQEVTPKTVEIGGASLSMPYVQIYLTQFYALYWYVFAAGGYFFDDSTYEEGQGTVWSITSYDDENYEMVVERDLLKILPDGSKWWKIKFSGDDVELLYEVKTDPEYRVVMFRFRDSSEDQAGEYTLKPEEVESWNPTETSVITEEEYADWIQGKEKITTPAGTYDTDYVKTGYSGAEYEWSYNWWVADAVPGSLVKFRWENSDDEWYQGELIEVTSGEKAELGSLE